ncbi:MAG: DUF177 domain-containing protein [Chloroflexi bacterium]|nr:DUF177 domain-containing protein [Chloroflexota bacterium]
MADWDAAEVRFNVSQLLREPVGSVRRYEISVPRLELDHDLTMTDLRGTAKLLRTGRGILITGNLEGDVPLECSRCLEEYTTHLNFELEEEFLQTVNVISGEDMEIAEADSDMLTIDANHTLDLTDVIRESALLALPMQPLCRPDCAGLCPQCGTNLNIEQCHCQPENLDARWVKLGELLKDNDLGERSGA